MMKLSIIIPVYNEKKTVEQVLKNIVKLKLPKIQKEIIVVDDGSTDGTSQLLKTIKDRYHFQLLRNSKNRGKGYSVRKGLSQATGEIILIQDADLEYKIEEYPQLIKPILGGKTDFVLGSRHLNTSARKARQFLDSNMYARVLNNGSYFYSQLVKWLLNIDITDPGTMYKVFRRECLDGITLRSNHFDIDWELVMKLVRKGHLPIEIPISYQSRSPKEGKKIKFLRDGTLVLIAIFRYRFFD